MNATVLKLGLLVVGAVFGAGVTYGVVKAVTGNSCSDDTTTANTMVTPTMMTQTMMTTTEQPAVNTTGTRVVDSLKFVVFVSRHGNRGGRIDYVDDPYPMTNSTYYPYGAWGLTEFGRLQAYKLGVKVRSLYNGFLPSKYNATDIYPTSDVVDRVVLSGMLVLAGLYPPTGFQVWNKDLEWQPIILKWDSPDKSNDLSYGKCTKFETETDKAWQIFEEQEKSNITYLASFFPDSSTTTYGGRQLYNVFDKFISEDLEGFKLPDWVKKIYPEPITDFNGKAFIVLNAATDIVTRLYVGMMLDDIIANWQMVMNGTSTYKMKYYSGHDSTLNNMMIALGVPRSAMGTTIKPGSGMVIELHQNSSTNQYYIQALFIDGTHIDLEPTPLNLICGDPCYYEDLITSSVRFTGANYTADCDS